MNKLELISNIWKKYGELKPVCDIGCGGCIIFDFDYVRFDKAKIMHDHLTAANVFGDFHNMNMFEDNFFGFIVSSHSLEHSRDINKALNEWIRILKIGGVMFLTWPGYLPKFSLDLLNKWDKLIKENKIDEFLKSGGEMGWVSTDYNDKLFLDDHFNLVTTKELKTLLPKNVEVIDEVQERRGTDSQIIIRKIS
jgi:ubiquinone/menaquinone biosynthesis C-methylase UbiE